MQRDRSHNAPRGAGLPTPAHPYLLHAKPPKSGGNYTAIVARRRVTSKMAVIDADAAITSVFYFLPITSNSGSFLYRL